MVSSGLMICSFYLKERYSKGENVCLLNHTILSEKRVFVDIIDMLNVFSKKHSTPIDDTLDMKVFSVDEKSITKHYGSSYSALSFVINSGAYGYKTYITNRLTNDVKYETTEDDASVKSFRCLVFVPKDVNDSKTVKGILIFQTLGAYGVKTIFTKQLKAFLSSFDLTLETRTVSARAFVEKLVKCGELHKITLVENCIPLDKSDNMLSERGREERVIYKPRLKESWLCKFLDFFSDEKDDDIFEINNKIYENIKATFTINGAQRTVNLNEVDRLSIVEEIPQSILEEARRHPAKLIEHMIQTANTYKEKMIFHHTV
jgi:hypothetical protein